MKIQHNIKTVHQLLHVKTYKKWTFFSKTISYNEGEKAEK